MCKKDRPLAPVHSRPRRIRSDRGLPQRGELFPFWKMMRRRPRRQRGGWLSQSVLRIPGMDLVQRLARRRRYNTHHDVVLLHLEEDEGDVKGKNGRSSSSSRSFRMSINPALRVFKVPLTDISINAYRMVTIQPTTTEINPMEFTIPAFDDYVDLGRSYFTMELRLKKSNNANLCQ